MKQLQQEGYAIFVVVGSLPDCIGDQVLANTLVSQVRKPHLINQSNDPNAFSGMDPNERQDLENALKASLADDQDDQQSLQMAIAMSMSECTVRPGPSRLTGPSLEVNRDPDDDDLQRALQMSMEQFRQGN